MKIILEKDEVLVVGLGRSGNGASLLLNHQGYKTKQVNTNDKIKNAKDYGFKRIVVSPGVSIRSVFFKNFLKKEVSLVSEIALALENTDAKVFGITGTNGKTTSVMLLNHIFNVAGEKSKAVGNCGNVFSKEVIDKDDVVNYCLELSSFMLMLPLAKKLKAACVLNLAPDHLNEHKNLKEYYHAKLKIYDSVIEDGFCVLNADDERLMDYYKSNIMGTEKKDVFFKFSLKNKVRGMYAIDGKVFFSEDGKNETLLFELDGVKLLGSHNTENILACSLLAFLAGVSTESIKEAIDSFEPVKHRLNFVCEKDKVVYINDSKGTNIGACLVAAKSMVKPTMLLLGGSDKGEDFKTLFDNLPSMIKMVVVYGANKKRILRAAKKCNFKKIEIACRLKDAVERAKSLASEGECILLSPASASFDEFNNFEERGNFFEEIAKG